VRCGVPLLFGVSRVRVCDCVLTVCAHREGDSQQVERKRHIGNDVVVIVFQVPQRARVRVC
jgi:hypothetical protein